MISSVNQNHQESAGRIGIIVIGRNEGERLRLALQSVLGHEDAPVMYVDSGSTDGSVELAKSMGARVHELSADEPFSAARARREGVEILLDEHPDVELIQFLDGDCDLAEGWIDEAVATLRTQREVAIVCGKLAESAPEASIYNRMSDLQWRVPAGDIASCGGIFMIRRAAYEEVGGFNAVLVTREEKELCDRIRHAGHRIVRVDSLMAWHDAGLLRFGQWWSRAVWGGYGDAVQISEGSKRLSSEHVHRIRRYLMWPLVLPLVMIGGLIASWWWVWMLLIPLGGVVAYLMLIAGMTRWRLRAGDSMREAITYACLRLVRRFATTYGFILYFVPRGKGAKRPDPHIARGSVAAEERTTPATSRSGS